MTDYEFSEHAYDMLKERNIPEDLVQAALQNPDKQETQADATVHYIKSIKEFGGCYLRVVMNPNVNPHRIVTLFFDRRLRRSR